MPDLSPLELLAEVVAQYALRHGDKNVFVVVPTMRPDADLFVEELIDNLQSKRIKPTGTRQAIRLLKGGLITVLAPGAQPCGKGYDLLVTYKVAADEDPKVQEWLKNVVDVRATPDAGRIDAAFV